VCVKAAGVQASNAHLLNRTNERASRAPSSHPPETTCPMTEARLPVGWHEGRNERCEKWRPRPEALTDGLSDGCHEVRCALLGVPVSIDSSPGQLCYACICILTATINHAGSLSSSSLSSLLSLSALALDTRESRHRRRHRIKKRNTI
jgi:hypothetical protein